MKFTSRNNRTLRIIIVDCNHFVHNKTYLSYFPPERCTVCRPPDISYLGQEIIIVIISEVILCTALTAERFTVTELLNIVQTASNATVAVCIECIEVDETTVKHISFEGETYEKLPDNIQRIYHSDKLKDLPHLYHQEPRTCCAKLAASGNGSEIYPRPIPIEIVKTMLLGKNKSVEKPLRFDKNDRIMTTSVSGFVRKMSDETMRLFEDLF